MQREELGLCGALVSLSAAVGLQRSGGLNSLAAAEGATGSHIVAAALDDVLGVFVVAGLFALLAFGTHIAARTGR